MVNAGQRQRSARVPPSLAAVLVLAGCGAYQPFDSASHLRGRYDERLGAGLGQELVVPFALGGEIEGWLGTNLKPAPSEIHRVEQVLDFIFRKLELRYSLTPTRSAVETYRAREGNCLSFVNLFVGVARHQRLSPFYVEVTDYQRWNYRDGLVLSQGHIVAGLYVKGRLETYDFLPYRPKAYKDFKPIDDLTAAAHFYNNLGAEAMLAGDLERARELLELAARIAPDFARALNNLGVCLARQGEAEAALATYRRGLAVDPDSVAIRTNLARLYQQLGRHGEAMGELAQGKDFENTNPFFFVYLADRNLAENDTAGALENLRRALRLDSEVPEVHLGFVELFLATGDLERARHHLERALKLDATHPEARRYAALLEARTSPSN